MMDKERDVMVARNVCMILAATTILMQFVLIAKFLLINITAYNKDTGSRH